MNSEAQAKKMQLEVPRPLLGTTPPGSVTGMLHIHPGGEEEEARAAYHKGSSLIILAEKKGILWILISKHTLLKIKDTRHSTKQEQGNKGLNGDSFSNLKC